MTDKDLERLHKALANYRRIAVLRYLTKRKDADLATLSDHLKLSYKATSKHLGLLTNAGILVKETRSGIVYFSISKGAPALVSHTLKTL